MIRGSAAFRAADQQIRIGAGERRRTAVAIAHVAGRPDALRVELAVDVETHRAACRLADDGDVMPCAVGDVRRAADRLAVAQPIHAEGEVAAAAEERDAVLAEVAGAGDVAIEENVAEQPAAAHR